MRAVWGGDDGESWGRSTETESKRGDMGGRWEMMMVVIKSWSVRRSVLRLVFWVVCSLMDTNHHIRAPGLTGFTCVGTVKSVPQPSARRIRQIRKLERAILSQILRKSIGNFPTDMCPCFGMCSK